MKEILGKIKKFLKIMLICLIVLAAIWCLIHRRVIIAWIKREPIPELPEWHKKFVRWILGKVGEGTFYCLGRAINGKNRLDEGASSPS
jgi:hypothetical protein